MIAFFPALSKSRDYSHSKESEMISKKTPLKGWGFFFLGRELTSYSVVGTPAGMQVLYVYPNML